MRLFETVTNLTVGAEQLRGHRYGVIEVAGGQFSRVVLRPLPKIISAPRVFFIGRLSHRRCQNDCIRIFYNQPLRYPDFLVLKYAESARNTSLGTLTRALAVLDEIARLKQSDALLCDASNGRITTKLLSRWGWEPHCPSWFHHHYIKRFYGVYPLMPTWMLESLPSPRPSSPLIPQQKFGNKLIALKAGIHHTPEGIC